MILVSAAMVQMSCTVCGVFCCHTGDQLRGHLEGEHGINMETKELDFDSMEQFLQWKSKTEGDEVFFSKRVGEQMVNSDKSRIYYGCHYPRSAVEGSLSKRLKASDPTVQICPASLIVSKMSSGKIKVKYYMTHIGHSVSMEPQHLARADRATAAGLIVRGSPGTDGNTVEKDSATRDLHHTSPGPVIMSVKQNDVMPWQQELQQSSSGQSWPVIVAVEQTDLISWQQELQHGSSGPVIVAEEQNVISWQQDLEHNSSVPVSVTINETNAMPCQEEPQYSNSVSGSVTVEETNAMQQPRELQHSTSGICENVDYCVGLCETCGISFRCKKALYKHLKTSHDVEINLHESEEKCYIPETTFSSVASLNFQKKMHTPAPQKMSCTECGVVKCWTREMLRSHLEREHGINMKTKVLEFDSMEQFLQWKKKIEGEEKVLFTKLSSDQMVNSEKSSLNYTCVVTKTGKKLRPLSKIGHTCPASLTVTKTSSGKTRVTYCMTHTCHSLSVGPGDSLSVRPGDTLSRKPGDSLSVGPHKRTYTKRVMVAGHIVPDLKMVIIDQKLVISL